MTRMKLNESILLSLEVELQLNFSQLIQPDIHRGTRSINENRPDIIYLYSALLVTLSLAAAVTPHVIGSFVHWAAKSRVKEHTYTARHKYGVLLLLLLLLLLLYLSLLSYLAATVPKK